MEKNADHQKVRPPTLEKQLRQFTVLHTFAKQPIAACNTPGDQRCAAESKEGGVKSHDFVFHCFLRYPAEVHTNGFTIFSS
jgi:hypothetical protein